MFDDPLPGPLTANIPGLPRPTPPPGVREIIALLPSVREPALPTVPGLQGFPQIAAWSFQTNQKGWLRVNYRDPVTSGNVVFAVPPAVSVIMEARSGTEPAFEVDLPDIPHVLVDGVPVVGIPPITFPTIPPINIPLPTLPTLPQIPALTPFSIPTTIDVTDPVTGLKISVQDLAFRQAVRMVNQWWPDVLPGKNAAKNVLGHMAFKIIGETVDGVVKSYIGETNKALQKATDGINDALANVQGAFDKFAENIQSELQTVIDDVEAKVKTAVFDAVNDGLVQAREMVQEGVNQGLGNVNAALGDLETGLNDSLIAGNAAIEREFNVVIPRLWDMTEMQRGVVPSLVQFRNATTSSVEIYSPASGTRFHVFAIGKRGSGGGPGGLIP